MKTPAYTDIGHRGPAVIWFWQDGELFTYLKSARYSSHEFIESPFFSNRYWLGRYGLKSRRLSMAPSKEFMDDQPPQELIFALEEEFPEVEEWWLFGFHEPPLRIGAVNAEP